MDSGTAALLGAGIGAAASTIGPAVHGWLGRRASSREESREQILSTLTDFMNVTSRRVTALRSDEGEEHRELWMQQNELAMRLSLIVPGDNATIAKIAIQTGAHENDHNEAMARAAAFVFTAGQWFRGEIPDGEVQSSFDLGVAQLLQRIEEAEPDANADERRAPTAE